MKYLIYILSFFLFTSFSNEKAVYIFQSNEVSLNTIQYAIDYAGQTKQPLQFMTDSVRLTFQNGETLNIEKGVTIKGVKGNTKIIIDQEPTENVQFDVFTIAQNLKTKFENIDIVGPVTGYIKKESDYTLSSDTISLSSAYFVTGDEGRYIYLDSAEIKARRLLNTVIDDSTGILDNVFGLDVSGAGHWYLKNHNNVFNTGGSDKPTQVNISLSSGQKYAITNPALDSSNISGYLYFDFNTVEYEKQIQFVKNDTVWFGYALPDTIANATVSGFASKYCEIILEECNITGNFSNAFVYSNNISGGDGVISIEKCRFSALVSGVAIYGDVESRNIHANVDKSHFFDSGTSINGDGNQHPGIVNGVHLYMHPHINANVTNCRFRGNERVSLKWYSSSGNPTPQKYANISNCYFENYGNPNVILYHNGVANVVNCNGDGKLQIKGAAKVTNCHFNTITFDAVKTGKTISISNCTAGDITEQYPNTDGFKIRLNSVHVNSTGAIPALDMQSGEYFVSDCTFTGTGANAIALQNRGGTAVFDNCDFVTSHTTGNFSSVKVSSTKAVDTNLTFDDCDFTGTQFVVSGSANKETNINIFDSGNSEVMQYRYFGAVTKNVNKRSYNIIPVSVEVESNTAKLHKTNAYNISVDSPLLTTIQTHNPPLDTSVIKYDQIRLIFIQDTEIDSTGNINDNRIYLGGTSLELEYDNSIKKYKPLR